MLKTRYERELIAPRKLVYEILRDRQTELNCRLPNIVGCRIVEDGDGDGDGKRRKIVAEVTGEAPIPTLLKPFLSMRQLIWYSIQHWDDTHWTCDYSTEAHYFKDNVDVSGRWFFNEKSPRRTSVVIEGIIKIDARGVPGVPPQLAAPISVLVEHIVHGMTRPNFDKVFGIVEAMMREDRRAARKK